jgi:hypothetical protein
MSLYTTKFILIISLLATVGIARPGNAFEREGLSDRRMAINADGSVIVQGRPFASWAEFLASDFAKANGLPSRCGMIATRKNIDGADEMRGEGTASDCTYNFTNPAPVYDPSVARYRIPVVVHVLYSITGQGYVEPERVQSQIDVLNEDFRAMLGTPGEGGADVQVEFYLATTDPAGNPSTGITYTQNELYFLDQLPYYDELAWDPNRYLNIYTNLPMGAGGAILGYVAFFPQDGPTGSNEDRVVILHSSFGRNSPNPPYDQGRTATHEVGHYLGLFHTFQDGCGVAAAPGCYSSGDRVCDTEPDSASHGGCPTGSTSCGFPVPIRNYMEYTDDTCMNNFTPEQARRIRCTLLNWRPLLYEIVSEPVPCPADVNLDRQVNVADLLAVIASWGTCPSPCPADVNDDESVNVADLLSVIGAWGPCE